MGFPGEEIVTKAVETFSSSLMKKMDAAEARRNREFSLKLKELEFYKSNYDKELKKIFDYWFELVRVAHIKDNKNLSQSERDKYAKEYAEYLRIDKVSKYKMDTLKYGGKETGRVFAMESKLHQVEYQDQPQMTALYMWCAILAVLKRDILGQEIEATDIIQVLVNDYDAHMDQFVSAQKYIVSLYIKVYNETPYWA